MKKHFKILVVILTVFTVLTAVAACTFSGQSPRQKMMTALDSMDEYYAMDMSMTIEAEADNESAEMAMQLKYIDNEQTQSAYISINYGTQYSDTLYYNQGYVYDDSGYSYDVYELGLDDFISGNQILPASSLDIDTLIEDSTVTFKKDGSLDKYTISLSDTALGDFFGNLIGDVDISGSLTFSVWLEKNSTNLKKLGYHMEFVVDGKKAKVAATIEINALDADVVIDFPENIANEIAKYKNMPMLSLIAEPASRGTVNGGGRYREGSYVSLSAYANYGYTFEGWYQDGEKISDYYHYSFYMPSTDMTLVAKFEVETPSYYINTSYEPYDYGYAYGTSYAKEGETVTLTASPYQDYVFLGWYENGEKVSNDKVYTFTMPAKNVNITAKFGQYVEKYENTADDAVTYYNLGGYKDVAYDAKTNKFAVLHGSVVDIYTADMTKEKTLSFLINPATIDAENGVLAIGFGNAMQIHLYDLTNNSEIKKIQTTIEVFELVLDGNMLIYASEDQWCEIVFYNISESKTIKNFNWTIYQPLLTVNRDDHILYAVETGLSSSKLMYFDTQTGDVLFEAVSYQFGYNYNRALYDGKYVHYYGGIFDKFSGMMVSSVDLNSHYNALKDFIPSKTVYDSDDLAFVFGRNGTTPMVGVYNNQSEEYIYRFDYAAASLEYMGENKYFAKNLGGNYIAIIDTSLIPDGFEGNIPSQSYNSEVTEDGAIKTLKYFENYTFSAADDSYIYLLSDTSFKLSVYDIVTLDEVYSERFMMKPACLDAYGGKLAIGFGDGRQFWVYDTNDWSRVRVQANECVFSIAIYKDKIVYMPVDQHCSIYVYSLSSKSHLTTSGYYSAYYATTAINREDGILYIGSRNSSSSDFIYFDLNTLTATYQSPFGQFSYNSVPIYFDGEFVHYYGRVFDKKTAMMISTTNKARAYNVDGFTGITTVYDDNSISVFTAKKGSVTYTVFYDLATQATVLEITGSAANVIKTQNGYILLNNSTNTVKTVALI